MGFLGAVPWMWGFLAFGEGAGPSRDDLRPGLVSEWFQLDDAIEDFPSVEGKKPNLRRIDKNVEIKLDLFENEGEVGLKLLWEGPGISKQIVPAGALFYKKDKDLDKD